MNPRNPPHPPPLSSSYLELSPLPPILMSTVCFSKMFGCAIQMSTTWAFTKAIVRIESCPCLYILQIRSPLGQKCPKTKGPRTFMS